MRNVAVAFSLLIVAAYVLTSLVVTAPSQSALATGGGSLRSAAQPMFAQAWKLFAPNIMRANFQLRVQGRWGAGDDVRVTEWLNLTNVELRGARGHLFPSRVQFATWNAGIAYYNRYNKLTSDQRDIGGIDFSEAFPGEDESTSYELFHQLLLGDHDNRGAVKEIVRYDQELLTYSALMLTAKTGQVPDDVRWQVYRTKPNDFHHRFETDAQYEPNSTTVGWRPVDSGPNGVELEVAKGFLQRYGELP